MGSDKKQLNEKLIWVFFPLKFQDRQTMVTMSVTVSSGENFMMYQMQWQYRGVLEPCDRLNRNTVSSINKEHRWFVLLLEALLRVNLVFYWFGKYMSAKNRRSLLWWSTQEYAMHLFIRNVHQMNSLNLLI